MGHSRGFLTVLAALAAVLATAVAPPSSTAGPPGYAAPLTSTVGAVAAADLAAGPLSTGPLVAATISGPPTSRLAGADRYAAAVSMSRHRFAAAGSAQVVYLTRGDFFADAVTAGTLTDGPVLLTRAGCGAVPSVVRTEIERLDPGTVIALGGTASVCDEALATAAGGRATDRISGATRQDVAAAIALRAFPSGAATVYLTSGAITPDAVVGGQLRDGPILLTSNNGASLPAATAATIAALGPSRVTALGGTATVPETLLTQAAAGRATSRLGGADRYQVAVNIARHAYPSRTARLYLARGDGSNYVDAVASGMLTDGPVVLTAGPCERVRSSTAAFMQQRYPSALVALGGTATLCDSTLRGASLEARRAVDCTAVACVALTFDDGPSWPTPTLLNTLAAQRVPVTFFVVGQQVDAYPQHARRAHVEGHDVENHTWNHPDLRTLSLSGQLNQTTLTDNELNQHGIPDADLLRPPYGAYDANTRRLGFPLIIWDVDPRDWEGPSSATIRSRVVSAARVGSIVLQHDLHNNSVLAVPGIIADLKARGYTFVTVADLVPSMRAGDLVYRQDRITRAGTAASPSDTFVTDDGTVLGPFVDEASVPGIAPSLTSEELLSPDGG